MLEERSDAAMSGRQRGSCLGTNLTRAGCAAAVGLITLAVGAARGESQRAIEVFEKRIRPALIEHCQRCHGVEEQEGGLRLDSRQGWQNGGDSGPAIMPGEPDISLLIQAVRYEDPDLEMPPQGKLPAATISAFEEWVRLGAPDPRSLDQPWVEPESRISLAEGRQFWSFRPVRKPPIPAVADPDWPQTDIDGFVLSRLESAQLEPVADADPEALVRRLYFDLIGLPPTPAEIDAFLDDPSPQAYSDLVDRLLHSKQFGQRWGRHWLDVVRFAESSGGGRTLLFPDAWRYRDYVIEAFNDDLPFNRFVKEQLAGDLLEYDSWQQHRRQLIATGFLLLGPTNYELQDKEVLEMDIVDEQLDTIGKAMLGMTIGCARCHDHKFDPIPTQDYYALAGILKSTKAVIHDNVSKWNTVPIPLPPDEAAVAEARKARIATLQSELKRAEARQSEAGQVRTQKAERDRLRAEVKRLKQELQELNARDRQRPVAMAVVEADMPSDIHVAIRGNIHNKGPVVQRGFLQVAATTEEGLSIPDHHSGRRELAEWLTHRAHPLTARVMANRVWYWLMGRGIVRTVDNFGKTGQPPSHPELLDHLAASFSEDGWSVKRLIRRIVLSRVYRLSAQHHVANHRTDPDNRFWWRMHRRRLEAEEIRDAILFVSGQLDLRYGGSNIKTGTDIEYGYVFDSTRRSVYLPVFRNTLPELFEVFDFADPNILVGQRTTSTIAPQALLLMNHPFVIDNCLQAAQRLNETASLLADNGRLDHVYREVLGRRPSTQERMIAERFIGGKTADSRQRTRRWALLYQTLFQSIDFRYLN